MPRKKKNAQIRVKKAPNTTLRKLRQGKKKHIFEPKKHKTLPYKTTAMEKNAQT